MGSFRPTGVIALLLTATWGAKQRMGSFRLTGVIALLLTATWGAKMLRRLIYGGGVRPYSVFKGFLLKAASARTQRG